MNHKPTARQIATANYTDYQWWLEIGFTTQEAAEWKAKGFSQRTAPTWKELGFTADEAYAWRNATSNKIDPIGPSEAAAARKNGETPETYRRNRNRTYPQPMQTR